MPTIIELHATPASDDGGAFISKTFIMTDPQPKARTVVHRPYEVETRMIAFAEAIRKMWPQASFGVDVIQVKGKDNKAIPGLKKAIDEAERKLLRKWITAKSYDGLTDTFLGPVPDAPEGDEFAAEIRQELIRRRGGDATSDRRRYVPQAAE
jgi:hypothetical protein